MFLQSDNSFTVALICMSFTYASVFTAEPPDIQLSTSISIANTIESPLTIVTVGASVGFQVSIIVPAFHSAKVPATILTSPAGPEVSHAYALSSIALGPLPSSLNVSYQAPYSVPYAGHPTTLC